MDQKHKNEEALEGLISRGRLAFLILLCLNILFFIFRACGGQSVIVALQLHKFLGRAAFDDHPLPDDRYDVSVLDGGEPVGNNDGRPVGHGVVQRPLDNLDKQSQRNGQLESCNGNTNFE